MRNRGVLKRTNYMSERIHVAQMSYIRAFFESLLADRAHIHIFDRRMSEFLRAVECRQAVETLVRYFCDTDMRLTWIGIRLVRKMRLGENAEQRGLTYLREANNSRLHMGRKDDNRAFDQAKLWAVIYKTASPSTSTPISNLVDHICSALNCTRAGSVIGTASISPIDRRRVVIFGEMPNCETSVSTSMAQRRICLMPKRRASPVDRRE